MIPQTFNDWKNCLINDCKINLTKDFVEKRLAVYQDKLNVETQNFIRLYGEQHHTNIIQWYKKYSNEQL